MKSDPTDQTFEKNKSMINVLNLVEHSIKYSKSLLNSLNEQKMLNKEENVQFVQQTRKIHQNTKNKQNYKNKV